MLLSAEQIRWFRLQRSGLGPELFGTPEAASAALVGVQAQIHPAAGLALWNRSEHGAATIEEFGERLHARRTLVKLWGQRRTLHVYATADWPMLQAAFSERSTWWEREIRRNGTPGQLAVYQAAIGRVRTMLIERGSMGRRELRALGGDLPEALLSPWGGVFAELVRTGHACHARWEGGEARYAAREHWLPSLVWEPPPVSDANVVLARRYFQCYGPASLGDFAYWRGATATEARPWLAALAGELAEVQAGEKKLLAFTTDLAQLAAAPPPRERWPVRLLGRFDPLLLGHREKDWVVPPEHYARVWRPAGHIEGVVLEYGKAVGTWRYDRAGANLVVTVFPFRRLAARVQAAVRQRARGVARFFGLKLGEVRISSHE